MVSKAGINSQSVNRLDALEEEGGAGLIGADNTNGLTGITVQAQINELAAMAAGGGLGMRLAAPPVLGTIASGVTGNILTVTAPNANSVIRLKVLYASSDQSGMTLTADGVDVYALKTFNTPSTTAAGNVFIHEFASAVSSAAGPILSGEPMQELRCTTFTLNKNAGNTTRAFTYAYEILEPIE